MVLPASVAGYGIMGVRSYVVGLTQLIKKNCLIYPNTLVLKRPSVRKKSAICLFHM